MDSPECNVRHKSGSTCISNGCTVWYHKQKTIIVVRSLNTKVFTYPTVEKTSPLGAVESVMNVDLLLKI